MRRSDQYNSPESRERTDARLRHLTRAAVLAAIAASAMIGIVIAKEHPGASSATHTAGTTPAKSVRIGGPTSRSSPPTSARSGRPPEATDRHSVVTSGGTSR